MTHHSTIIAAATALSTDLTEGLVAGTTVLTLTGEKPVEMLTVGDRVITRSGARHIVAMRSTVMPVAKLICISASALGVEQPADDMRVMPEQGIHIRDWRAKALKGVAQTVIAAKDLLDGEYIRCETVVGATLHALHFAQPEVIYANGVEVTCAPVTVTA
ncbi:Hint domain-containing protein [Pseudorhodobacter antarcticus]|uniref:Hint domain-containing protein n=1 Tax=Pseudorhodobacter antarcticus TaxID=1077947 RepID=A0A1H8D801_9RHOB|nr:Hint domain-containing protein [Pseudorhodobacter antarcticus]SEN02934.1 Hint domain-containing protein [Pseudorhodobacter antarcticus]